MTRSFYTFAALPAISVSIYCQPSGNVVRQVPRVNDENLAGRYRDGGSALAQCSGCRTCSDTVHSHSGGPFPSTAVDRCREIPTATAHLVLCHRTKASPSCSSTTTPFRSCRPWAPRFQGERPHATCPATKPRPLGIEIPSRTSRSGAAPIAKPEVKPSHRSPHVVRAQASHADGQLDPVARDSAGLRVWPAPHRLRETRHRWPAPRLGRHRRERFPGIYVCVRVRVRVCVCVCVCVCCPRVTASSASCMPRAIQ
jgi:hypothetical protein